MYEWCACISSSLSVSCFECMGSSFAEALPPCVLRVAAAMTAPGCEMGRQQCGSPASRVTSLMRLHVSRPWCSTWITCKVVGLSGVQNLLDLPPGHLASTLPSVATHQQLPSAGVKLPAILKPDACLRQATMLDVSHWNYPARCQPPSSVTLQHLLHATYMSTNLAHGALRFVTPHPSSRNPACPRQNCS